MPDPALVARFREDLARTCDVVADTVLVAVSGGADSVALLLLTHAVLGDRCLAATVDHGLRAESAAEALNVAAICAERGIGHTILAGPLPDRVGRTANVSARARALRYRLLEEHASDHGETWLATAHHADDQLETLVMRLNRGAGVSGLAGIRRSGGRIVRPLLDWRRAELDRLVAECGIVPVSDPSNVDDRFDRARLRKVLAEIDWLDVEHVGRSASALGDAEDALAWAARRLRRERCREEADALVLDPGGLPFELLRRIVASCLDDLDPDSAPTGPALVRFVETLKAGHRAMLGDVLATVRENQQVRVEWVFAPAPPRRSG